VDKKLVSKTGYCLNCLSKRETRIKVDGLWEAYEDYKIYNNMIAYGKDVVAQFQQAYNDTKQTYEVVNEDGTIEKWSMERNVDELKAEILTDITNFKEEIQQATKLRNDAWDKLKDKGYDLVKPPID
jgi:4-hydroxy-3-methylbut-2-enyl diphosphate reductase IspH